jgi:hypothetical protein
MRARRFGPAAAMRVACATLCVETSQRHLTIRERRFGLCELTRCGHRTREQARRLFYLIVKPETLAQVAEFWPDAKLKTQNPKLKTALSRSAFRLTNVIYQRTPVR